MKLKKVVVSLAGLALLGVGTIAFLSNSVSAAETDVKFKSDMFQAANVAALFNIGLLVKQQKIKKGESYALGVLLFYTI